MTAPTTRKSAAPARTYSRAAVARHQEMAGHIVADTDLDRAYGRLLELEALIEELRAMVREDLAVTAANLVGDVVTGRGLASRHGIEEHRVRAQLALAKQIRAQDETAAAVQLDGNELAYATAAQTA